MQVGKTTSAEYLVRKYGFVKLAFADKLKEIARDLFPEQFESGEKPRKLLQDLGIKMREIDEERSGRLRRCESLNCDKRFVHRSELIES